MTSLLPALKRPDAGDIGIPMMAPRTAGFSTVSNQLAAILADLKKPENADLKRGTSRPVLNFDNKISQTNFGRTQSFHRVSPALLLDHEEAPAILRSKGIEEQLYDALASFKVRTATVAMHLDRGWRDRLFRQMDSLLDMQSWERDDAVPTLSSFSTFLRMLVFLSPERRPGLGATSDGKIIAAWTVGSDRLTIECLPNDFVRWSLSVDINGDRERAAASTPLSRLSTVLAPYNPERWFNADNVPG